MKRYGIIILLVSGVVVLAGCGKKQQTLEEMQAPMSIESLATSETKVAPEPLPLEPAIMPQGETVAPPITSAMPTTKEIQSALKNAGFYAGIVDGKKGPMTKKAIEDFQRANNLEPDGKVGPKTWAVLNKYLNTVPVEPKKKTRR